MNVDLQTCLVEDLLACDDLTGVVGRGKVFDDVPERTAYPYVQVGEVAFADLGDKSVPGNDVTVTIHFWSRNKGKREVERAMSAVWRRWHERENLIASGFQITLIRHVFSHVMNDPDGKTRHGVANYRVITYGA